MTLADGNQYKLQISCMCAAVDRFACFAATLNCVIIKKDFQTFYFLIT
jgi:hypothetical protein